MTDKKIDLSSLSNFELKPNWETTSKKVNKEFKKTKDKKKNLLKTNNRRTIAKPLFDINITYDHSVISKIKDKIRESGITYSIEEIANTIISAKERLSFKIEKQNKENFFEVLFDNRIFSSRDNAIKHITHNGLDSLIKISSVEEQIPNGNYNTVLKCPKSNKLLPPKNYHDFENCIYQHMYENKVILKYEDFVNNLEQVNETEVVGVWRKTPIKKFTYKFKDKLDSEKKYESIKLITNEIKKFYNKFVKEKNKIVISGVTIDRLDDLLRNQLKEFYDKNHKWKKDLFFNIIINLKKSGFHIFKSGDHKKMYACPVKPKKFKEEELSKICYSIIQMVKENIKISKKVLINSDFNQNISKDSILYELKWLLKEGYIKEFKDGQISIN